MELANDTGTLVMDVASYLAIGTIVALWLAAVAMARRRTSGSNTQQKSVTTASREVMDQAPITSKDLPGDVASRP